MKCIMILSRRLTQTPCARNKDHFAQRVDVLFSIYIRDDACQYASGTIFASAVEFDYEIALIFAFMRLLMRDALFA